MSSSVSLFSMYYYYTKIISSDLSARWSLCTGCKTPQANFNQNIRNRNRFDCDEFERMNKNPSTGIPKKNKSHKWNRKLHFSVSSLILCHFVSVFDLVSFRFVLLCLWLWFFICLFLCLCLSSYRNHVESFNRWFHWYCGCGWVCVCVFSFYLIFRLSYTTQTLIPKTTHLTNSVASYIVLICPFISNNSTLETMYWQNTINDLSAQKSMMTKWHAVQRTYWQCMCV